MTDQPAKGRRPLFYIVEGGLDNVWRAGDLVRIGSWKRVNAWAKDGSLSPGDVVHAVYRVKRQPKIGKRP